MNLNVRIQRQPGGYMASCPSLPGCYVTATTRSEARREIRRAMLGYVNRLDETLPRELGRLLHSGGTC